MSDRRIFSASLRQDFPSFLHKSFNTILPATPYLLNWHLDAIAYELQLVWLGRTRRLIINQPPRSLKSIAVVAYVAWLLGRNPAMRIIVVSYNVKYAAELHRQFRMVVESDWYRHLFPGTRWTKQTDTEFVTTQGGGRFATSIGGELTGRGGDLLILDDPMSATDAHSEVARNEVKSFFSTTLISRLNQKKTQAIIVVMQRLHEDDLSGYLLEQGGWRHLSLPAVAPEDVDIPIGYGRVHHRLQGEVLHPAREDLATLDRTKRDMGGANFTAQYQQAPIPIEGNVVKRAWIDRSSYDVLPSITGPTRKVQSWDIATTTGSGSNYSVCTTWLVSQNDVFLIDVFRDRLSYPDLRRQIANLAKLHGADQILIEEAGPGVQLLQDLQAAPPDGIPRPIGRRPEGSKQDRMSAASARFESGSVHLPKEASWRSVYLLELLGFDGTRYDDQVDSTSQFLIWWWTAWRRFNGGPLALPIIVTIPRRPDPFDFFPR